MHARLKVTVLTMAVTLLLSGVGGAGQGKKKTAIFLPTPFTVEQLRAEMVPGWTIVVKTAGAEGPVREKWVVETANEQGVRIRFERGKASRVQNVDWVELKDHAQFPVSVASRTMTTQDTALGKVKGWLYTIRGGGGMVTEMLFGKDLPGPPVRIVKVRDGKREVVFEQLKRSRAGTAADR